MSIIYEALKKIEGKEDLRVEPRPLSIEKIIAPKKERLKEEASYRINKFVFFVAVGVGIFSLFLFVMHFFYSRTPRHQSHNQPKLEKTAFINNVLSESSKSGYYLQGIIYTENNPIALINGKRVKQGQRIGEAIVKSLSESGVELETKEATIQLTLE